LQGNLSRKKLSHYFHPRDAAFEVVMHVFHAVVMDVAVSRQDPLKFVIEKFFHRASLFRPRVPGNTAKRSQSLARGRPGQVIASEQKLIFIKKDNVTASMSRSRNYEQIVVEPLRLF